VTQVASWNLITASDQNNNLLSVAKSDVFILQCLVKVFNLMESQNLIRSEAEVQVTAADQENVFPSWRSMFLISRFFSHMIFVVPFLFQFLVELVATCSCPGSSFKLSPQKQCGESNFTALE